MTLKPSASGSDDWAGVESAIATRAELLSEEMLDAYEKAPRLVEEHVNLERSAIEGGYSRRQLYELIQNGADELLGDHGRIHVVLTDDALYVANQGNPLSETGVGALLSSHRSSKSGDEIGRYGLGFKSVLAVTNTPEIFSRTGSIRFDPEEARRRIAERVETTGPVPTLRLARPMDPLLEASKDGVLAELMPQASTVVRLPRDAEDIEWLSEDIRSFPSEFVLFSRHVSELILDDRTASLRRLIQSYARGDVFVIAEDGAETEWRVFSTKHEPSPAARHDGGTLASRATVPLVWAVPLRARGRGKFWAFFPTQEETTLSGVANAPWKLSVDRASLIEGPFNEELLDTLSLLVLEHLPDLMNESDPGAILDLLPGRGREAVRWADRVVTTKINDGAHFHASVPDIDGQLEFPSTLRMRPRGIPPEALTEWSAVPNRPSDWPHPSVEHRERRPRAEIYMRDSPPVSVQSWLEELVTGSADASESAGAIITAASVTANVELAAAAQSASIVLTHDGTLARPSDGDLFIPNQFAADTPGRYVHADVLAVPGVRNALTTLGLTEVDPARALGARLKSGVRGFDEKAWDATWALVRRLPSEEAAAVFREAKMSPSRLLVRTEAGRYRTLGSVLLPGEIVAANSDDDANSVIDTAFHRVELDVISHVGGRSSPVDAAGSPNEAWYAEYKREALEAYIAQVKKSGAAPNREYLDFRRKPFPGPLTPLRDLRPTSRMRFTTAVLRASRDLSPWMVHHTTVQGRYPEMAVPHPVVWMVRQYGLLDTSRGPARVEEAVAPALEGLSAVLPVARCSPEAAKALGLPSTTAEFDDSRWESLLSSLTEVDDDLVIGNAYAAAARAGIPGPPIIRCRVGEGFDVRPPSSVVVVIDPEIEAILRRTGEAHISLRRTDDAEFLIDRWELRSGAEAVSSDVQWTASGEPEPVGDRYPLLRFRLDDVQRAMTIVPCSALRLERFTENGRVPFERDVVLHDDMILVRDHLGDDEILMAISRTLGLGLTSADIDAARRNLERRLIRDLKVRIRGCPDDTERVLAAIGPEPLRGGLPIGLMPTMEAMSGPLNDRGVAELALAVHGIDVLRQHARALEERGLTPPSRWAGSRRAVAFVRELGFGAEYAGFETRDPGRLLEVEGPPDLGPLHDYQLEVVEEIRQVLRGEGGFRGLLSLPTGAGKTRVTVEALIEAVHASELDSPILWIAQTWELCEQAVQTWDEIWRAKGPRRRLTVSRLWKAYEAEEVEHGEQVVVATIQKLARLYEKPEYEWLKKASCIVVDEAHTSIGPSYTGLLTWQGMGRGRDRAPLIGLTATPYRTNEAEMRQLVARYGERRLDLRALGGDDAYPHLQSMGVLSYVDHETLPGVRIELDSEQRRHFEQYRDLPDSVLRQLSNNVGRNEALLDSIGSLEGDWSILLFAASIQHAQTMAALLTRAGIPAAAITGETDSAARRHYIDAFRKGRIRVLTNYMVLTAGFDAPKVRAVYVARPTYTANTYQQMIGRGLRGPMNGGTERCLLVNVEDNVAQFGARLAFHEFDYLWSRDGSASETNR